MTHPRSRAGFPCISIWQIAAIPHIRYLAREKKWQLYQTKTEEPRLRASQRSHYQAWQASQPDEMDRNKLQLVRQCTNAGWDVTTRLTSSVACQSAGEHWTNTCTSAISRWTDLPKLPVGFFSELIPICLLFPPDACRSGMTSNFSLKF